MSPKLIATLLALNLADAATTIVGLAHGYHETAATASTTLSIYGAAGIVGLGIIGFAIELAVLARLPRFMRSTGWALVLVLSLVPVLSNFVVLARA